MVTVAELRTTLVLDHGCPYSTFSFLNFPYPSVIIQSCIICLGVPLFTLAPCFLLCMTLLSSQCMSDPYPLSLSYCLYHGSVFPNTPHHFVISSSCISPFFSMGPHLFQIE